jgi:hypothetical protein
MLWLTLVEIRKCVVRYHRHQHNRCCEEIWKDTKMKCIKGRSNQLQKHDTCTHSLLLQGHSWRLHPSKTDGRASYECWLSWNSAFADWLPAREGARIDLWVMSSAVFWRETCGWVFGMKVKINYALENKMCALQCESCTHLHHECNQIDNPLPGIHSTAVHNMHKQKSCNNVWISYTTVLVADNNNNRIQMNTNSPRRSIHLFLQGGVQHILYLQPHFAGSITSVIKCIRFHTSEHFS